MNLRDIDLIDKPISTNDYAIYNIDALPKVMLGFRVKHKFDEARLKIKSKYKPKYVSHFSWTSELEPTFIYGIEVNLKKRLQSLLAAINNSSQTFNSTTYEDYVTEYQALLSKYSLSCDSCYSYLSDGIYPIDLEHLNDISRKDFTNEISCGFKNILQKTKNPWYFNIPNVNIFILGRSAGYSVDYKLNR
tara:strand:+ start:88 stop:657 length:570 start_codon:yes stop_codon:yes gene_type:complete